MGELVIKGGNVVTPEGILSEGTLTIKDGIIQEIRPGADMPGAGRTAGMISAQNLYVLPGLISLQCSFLEKELFPRPGVEFPLQRALIQADKVMASSGLVEAYHTVRLTNGATGSSLERARFIARSNRKLGLLCTHRLHLISDECAITTAQTFGHSGNLLSFLPSGDQDDKIQTAISFMVRKPWSATNVQRASSSRLESPPEFSAVFQTLQLASSPREAKSLGALIAAKVPYLVGSPSDKLLEQALKEDLVDICVADCYAPSMLYMVFLLDRLGLMPLHKAVNLSSLAPAQVLGKGGSEGSLEAGKTASLSLVEVREEIPRVVKTIVRGELVFSTGSISS